MKEEINLTMPSINLNSLTATNLNTKQLSRRATLGLGVSKPAASQAVQSLGPVSKSSPKALNKNVNSINIVNSNDQEEQRIPKLLFFSKEDLNLPQHLFAEINNLKEYYEKKLEVLESEKESFKRRVRMEQSLSQFIYNFDLVNEKLCDEIDKINENHKANMMIEKEKFETRMHELKNLIFQKILSHRDENRALIIQGTSLRESLDKLQVKALIEELIFASDAYENLYNKNIYLVNKLLEKEIEINELNSSNKHLKNELLRLVGCLKTIKTQISKQRINNHTKKDEESIHSDINKLIDCQLVSSEANQTTKIKKDVKDLKFNNFHEFQSNSSKYERKKIPKKKVKDFSITSINYNTSNTTKFKTHWRFNDSININFRDNEIPNLKNLTLNMKKATLNPLSSLNKQVLPKQLIPSIKAKNQKYKVYNSSASIISFLKAE